MSGTWKTIEIAGKPADIFDPGATQPCFGILDLHDETLETLRDRKAFTRWFDHFQLACVCPHGQRCWWVERICPEFDPDLTPEHYLLQHVLPFFTQVWGLQPRSIGLQGIGMGGQGALRLAFKHPELFAVVAAISSTVDYHDVYGQGSSLDALYHSKEQCRQDTVLLHIHPTQYPPHIFFCIDPEDEWFRGNDRLHEKLNALGITHRIDFTTRAGGHRWSYFDHMAEPVEQFVYAGLQQESRRLL
jgi:pimeloyl-ACP methyl ester carboxylesterase